MASTIRVALGVDGAKEFQNAMKQSDAAIKALGTELKLTTAEMGKEADSEKGLAAQNDVLQRSVSTLKEKLAEQEKALEAVGKQFGEGSVETIKFQDAVNQTKLKIAEAENKIRDNEDAMKALGNETKETEKKTSTFGDVLKANLASEAIVAGVKALANAVAEVGKQLVSVAGAAVQWADDLNTLSMQTGLTTEQLQKYQYAADIVDVSVETITGSMTKLTRNMSSAKDGTGAAAEAFAQLGVAITDDSGALRDNEDVFNDVIAALGDVGNETERDALAMSLFGKSAQELNPLILGGADALKELGKEAEDAGLILDSDALKSLNNVSDALAGLKNTAQGAGRQLTASFAPQMSAAIELAKGYLQQLVGSFQSGGIGALGDTVGAILSDLTGKLTELLPTVMEFGTNLIQTLITGVIQNLPAVAEMAIVIITQLADSLGEYLPELVPVAVEAILTLVNTLTDPKNIGNLVKASVAIIMGLANGLIAALPQLLAEAPVIISNLVTALIENIPLLISAAWDLMIGLVTGIITNLPEVAKAAGQIITTLLEGLAGLWQDMLDVGSNIVSGIWQGISNAAGWLWSQITGFVNGIVGGVKNLLGIQSPSKVFAGIGENMALGLGEGFEDTMSTVSKDIQGAMDIPFSASVTGTSQHDTVINLTTTLDGEVLARNQYKYNMREQRRHGVSLVGGLA